MTDEFVGKEDLFDLSDGVIDRNCLRVDLRKIQTIASDHSLSRFNERTEEFCSFVAE